MNLKTFCFSAKSSRCVKFIDLSEKPQTKAASRKFANERRRSAARNQVLFGVKVAFGRSIYVKMVEANGIELTEQEAELYDRQIRLWGLDSQKR